MSTCGLCCSQYGFCARTCANTCQCKYSGAASYCPGSPILDTAPLPVALPGAVCGVGVASCSAGSCCSVYGFCGAQGVDCDASCNPFASGPGSKCRGALSPVVRSYSLVLANGVGDPDGFSRPIITVNGETPGPTITCNVGDRLSVRVLNQLGEATSIHWHGMVQRGTVSQDGVAGVTQRGIPPGGQQFYNFICAVPGTYWYHAHYKVQYVDGLKGALIVNDPANPFSGSVGILQLSDWYHDVTATLLETYLTPEAEGAEPVPVSATINGVGQGDCSGVACSYADIRGTWGTSAAPKTRLHLINEAGFAVFTVSVDGHWLKVVAVDAIPIKASDPLRAVRINAGQRYLIDVYPDAGHPVKAPAWIRAQMQQAVFATDAQNPLVLGVLRYKDVIKLPTTTTNVVSDLDELLGSNTDGSTSPYDFQPLTGAVPPPSTTQLTLTIDFNPDPAPTDITWAHFNGISMRLPNNTVNSPSLLELALNGTLPTSTNFGWNAVPLIPGAVVDLIVNNYDGGEHPLHLHGHWMWMMAFGMPDDGEYTGQPLKANPILRDTVTVNANSYVVLRFVADNPGVWALHCHIDWHKESGLMMAFVYGVN